GDRADRLFCDDGQEVANRRMVVGLPKPDESLAFELAAEERTDAGPGQAKRGVGLAIVAEQKGIAQRLADRAGADIRALGRHARAAPIVPMSEYFQARSVFHRRRCLISRSPAASSVPGRSSASS